MRNNRAIGMTWVRACLLIPTAAIVYTALYVLTGSLVEGGHEQLGNAVGIVDFAVLFGGFFLGPVWVTKAWQAPAPPRNDDGPGDGGGPSPTGTPGGSGRQHIAPTAPAASTGSSDEIDGELRALLDQEQVAAPLRG